MVKINKTLTTLIGTTLLFAFGWLAVQGIIGLPFLVNLNPLQKFIFGISGVIFTGWFFKEAFGVKVRR